MEQKMKSDSDYFLYPFKGTGYFLTHPSLWLLQLFAMLVLLVALLIIFAVILYFAWPLPGFGFWHSLWGILKAFGLSSAGLLIGFVVLMPVLLTLALDKMVRKILLSLEGEGTKVTFLKSVYTSTVIFFKTIFWRIFWPVVGILSAIFLGPLGVFIAQLGIGHLAVIDGVDLTLALQGHDTAYRMQCYRERRWQIFSMGFFAALLSLVLSVTILGWLIWVPGVIAGCTLWVLSWPKKISTS